MQTEVIENIKIAAFPDGSWLTEQELKASIDGVYGDEPYQIMEIPEGLSMEQTSQHILDNWEAT